VRALAVCQDELVIRTLHQVLAGAFDVEFLVESRPMARRLSDDGVPVTVAEAHASYPVMCRADGMMYHDALSVAARGLGLAVERHDRGEEVGRAADRLGVSVEEVERFLQTAGQRLGPPWQKEHRLAAAAAIGVLAARLQLSLFA